MRARRIHNNVLCSFFEVANNNALLHTVGEEKFILIRINSITKFVSSCNVLKNYLYVDRYVTICECVNMYIDMQTHGYVNMWICRECIKNSKLEERFYILSNLKTL